MSGNKKGKDLPGFVWDPKKKRYFKSPPPSAGPSFAQHLPSSSSEGATAAAEPSAGSETLSVRRKKTPNLLDVLAQRQTGCLLSHVFERDVLKKRLASLRKIRDAPFSHCSVKAEASVNFLRTGVNSVYAIWHSGADRSPMIVGEMRHDFSPSSHLTLNVVADRYDLRIEDVCDGFNDLEGVFFIANTTHQNAHHKGLVYMHRRPSHVGDRNTEICRFGFKHAMRSFSCNNHTSTMALGLDGMIAFVSLHDGLNMWDVKKLDSEVLSLQFNKEGNLLYSGHSNGRVVSHDIRDPLNAFQLRIDSYAVAELALLSNENYIVCGDVNGRLLKIDLRMKAEAVHYYGHRRSAYKNPISISENHHLLCATGNDQKARLWSLNDGGEPLLSFTTPGIMERLHYHSVLVSGPSKCLIYQVQRNRVFVSAYGCR